MSSKFAFIRFFINFEEDDNLVLILSAFKMDFVRKEVHISFTTIMNESSTCSVIVLCTLFIRFPANLIISLFTRIFDSYSRDHLIKTIKNALLDADLNSIDFSDHSLRRKATIFAITANIPREEIKALRK